MKRLLRLYPPAWRRRYQEEMLALLEEHRFTWRTRVDLLMGALDAWMDPQLAGRQRFSATERALRVRRAHCTLFWAFPVFVAVFLLSLDGIDDAFQGWNHAHAAVTVWRSVMQAAMAVGFIAFLATGLLLACALIHQVIQQRPPWLRWVVPGGVVLLLALWLLRVPVPAPPSCLLPFVLAGFPLTIAAALSRCEVSPRLLRYALAPIGCTVVGMVAHVLFYVGWAFVVWNVTAQAVPQLAHAGEHELLFSGSWHWRLLAGLLFMTGITAWAVRSFTQALKALMGPGLPAR
jgi:hypothetical protein